MRKTFKASRYWGLKLAETAYYRGGIAMLSEVLKGDITRVEDGKTVQDLIRQVR